MDKESWDGIVFLEGAGQYNALRHADRVLHILCLQGGMSFVFQDVRYNIVPGDYVILPNAALASDFSASAEFEALAMSLSEAFVASMALRSNYGIIGHMSLLQNPVMKLSPHDFRICREDMELLRSRMQEESHLFRVEMIGHLLMAHILDLYDIHARDNARIQVSERTNHLLRRFIGLLYRGDYVRHRNLEHYASLLCITPHYLSEICRKASGEPATYWIDRFCMHEIIRLLRQKEIPLTEIADRLEFSSLSYFSRYVQKRLGVSPSEYRNLSAARPDGADSADRKA